MEQLGEIHSIGQTQEVGQKGFKKRIVVLRLLGDDQKPEWPQYCAFEFVKDSCAKLDPFKVGQTVTVEYSLNGRLWTAPGKPETCFNTLKAWRINELKSAAPQQAAPAQQADFEPGQYLPDTLVEGDNNDEDGDSIPF